jgi:hypothetical protein
VQVLAWFIFYFKWDVLTNVSFGINCFATFEGKWLGTTVFILCVNLCVSSIL